MGFVLLMSGVGVACTPSSESSYRTYTETNLAATAVQTNAATSSDPLAQILMDRPYSVGLRWLLPSEWTEQASSGIRFATFLSKASGAEMVIVSFPGDVGTLQANVERWLRQMNAQITTPQLKAYLSALAPAVNAGGVGYVKVDLTQFALRGSSTAIVAVILKFQDQSVFLKMQDERRKLEREQANFDAFIASLQLGNS